MSRHLLTRNISSKSMHAFLSNLANRQTDKHGQKHLPPPLLEVTSTTDDVTLLSSKAEILDLFNLHVLFCWCFIVFSFDLIDAAIVIIMDVASYADRMIHNSSQCCLSKTNNGDVVVACLMLTSNECFVCVCVVCHCRLSKCNMALSIFSWFVDSC